MSYIHSGLALTDEYEIATRSQTRVFFDGLRMCDEMEVRKPP